jgi:hypothetical protein
MRTNLTAALAAPGIALAAIGAALASGAAERAAYDGPAASLSVAELRQHADAIFDCADLDKSGALEAEEYSALALVTAELSRLNGFVALHVGAESRTVQLPRGLPEFSRAERVRVEAVARKAFYASAGADSAIERSEFASALAARFTASDANRDGGLKRRELISFAAKIAAVPLADA